MYKVSEPPLLQFIHCCSTSMGRGLPLSQPHRHCIRASSIGGIPMFCTSTFEDFQCCISSIIARPLLSHTYLHCIRTSKVARPVAPLSLDIYYCRNSNAAVTPLTLNLYCPKTCTVKRCPQLQQLHCDSSSTVSRPQCCSTSTVSGPPLSQCLHCCRIYCPRTCTVTASLLSLIL